MTAHPSAYRKAIAQLASVLLAGYFVVRDAVNSDVPLSNWAVWAQVIIALAGAVLVYAPENPWAKVVASFATVAGSTIVAAVSDNTITGTEAMTIFGLILSFAAVALVDNKPVEPVRPADAAVVATAV